MGVDEQKDTETTAQDGNKKQDGAENTAAQTVAQGDLNPADTTEYKTPEQTAESEHRENERALVKWTRVVAFLVGSSRVDLQACKLEYSIVSPK